MTEADYVALGTTFCHVVSCLNTFTGVAYTIPITIMPDNTYKIYVIVNRINNAGKKHIDIADHCMRECLKRNCFTLRDRQSDYNTPNLMMEGWNSVVDHVHMQCLELGG